MNCTVILHCTALLATHLRLRCDLHIHCVNLDLTTFLLVFPNVKFCHLFSVTTIDQGHTKKVCALTFLQRCKKTKQAALHMAEATLFSKCYVHRQQMFSNSSGWTIESWRHRVLQNKIGHEMWSLVRYETMSQEQILKVFLNCCETYACMMYNLIGIFFVSLSP